MFFKALRILARGCHGHAPTPKVAPKYSPMSKFCAAWVGGGVITYGSLFICDFMMTDEERQASLERAYPMPPDLLAEKKYREQARLDPSYTNPTPCSVCNRAMEEHSVLCDMVRPPGYIHAKMQASVDKDRYCRTPNEQKERDAMVTRNKCRRAGCSHEMHLCDL